MLQPGNFVISNISKAPGTKLKKKKLTLFLESKLSRLIFKRCKQKEKAFQMTKTELLQLSYKVKTNFKKQW